MTTAPIPGNKRQRVEPPKPVSAQVRILGDRNILSLIFSFLPHHDCPAISITCRRWRYLGRFCLGSRELAELVDQGKNIADYSKEFPNFSRINLYKVPQYLKIDGSLDYILSWNPGLKQTCEAVEQLAARLTQIKFPRTLTENQFYKLMDVVRKCEKLKVLDLEGCYNEGASDPTSSQIPSLQDPLNQVEELRLSARYDQPEPNSEEILRVFPNLRILIIKTPWERRTIPASDLRGGCRKNK